jgi:hypothetical protein
VGLLRKEGKIMETLKIDKSIAKELFPTAPEFFKKVLINTFGKGFFSEKITDRVKTFEDAYMEADNATKKEYDLSTGGTEDEVAYRQLKLIARVLRGDWKPNWNDSNEKKWFPWFQWSSGSGFGFSGSICAYVSTVTYVGSRLCFPTKELSDYFGEQFIEIHRKLLTI